MSSDRSRFGCIVMQNEPVETLRERWRAVEDAGFDSLWVADHLMTFPKMGTLLEAWTTLATMASSTSRIRIGTLVTNITYRNPALVARQAITIDHLSAGRLEVGIGAAGTRPDDALVAGVEQWDDADRAARFGEFVEIVDGLLSGRLESFDGTYYRTAGFGRGQWQVQEPRPPLVLAAHGPKTLQVAARFADTWNAMVGFGRRGAKLLSFLRGCNSRLDELAAEAGRDPSTIRRSVLVYDGGFRWWESAGALSDFLGSLGEAGTQDFVFYYPPAGPAAGEIGGARFLDLFRTVVAAS